MIKIFLFQYNSFLCCYWPVSLMRHPLIYAQSLKLSGQIMDSDGRTIPRINVVIKGTLIDTIADSNAAALDTKDENVSLVFSFIDLVTQEIPVNGRSTIDMNQL